MCRKLAQVPAQRSILASLSFAAYIATLIRALVAPEIGVSELLPIYVALALCTTFDFTIYLASRGEHYVYMLLCLIFPDWRSGMQCVQLALWSWAGVSKMGPWFQYVLPFITKDSAVANLLPRGFLAKILLKDYPKDVNPSKFTTVLAWTGAFLEIIFPAFCISPVPLRYFGAYGMICYHAFIGICMPFASVFEWNFFCMVLAYYLFVLNTPLSCRLRRDARCVAGSRSVGSWPPRSVALGAPVWKLLPPAQVKSREGHQRRLCRGIQACRRWV